MQTVIFTTLLFLSTASCFSIRQQSLGMLNGDEEKDMSIANEEIDRQQDLITVAINENDIEQVIDMLEKGLNPDYIDDNREPILHYAANLDSTEIFDLLLKMGANPNILANNGNSVLHEISVTNSIELLDIILKYNPDLNSRPFTTLMEYPC